MVSYRSVPPNTATKIAICSWWARLLFSWVFLSGIGFVEWDRWSTSYVYGYFSYMYMCAPHLCGVLKKLEDSVTFCGMAVQFWDALWIWRIEIWSPAKRACALHRLSPLSSPLFRHLKMYFYSQEQCRNQNYFKTFCCRLVGKLNSPWAKRPSM